MCTINVYSLYLTVPFITLSSLSAEPHVLVLYKHCGKTAEAAGCDSEPPPEGICRIKLNKVGCIPQRCRKMCATANRNWGKCIAVYKIISWRLHHSFEHCSRLNWEHQFEQVAPVWSGLLEHLILKKGQCNWQHSGVCLWWEKVDKLYCSYANTALD